MKNFEKKIFSQNGEDGIIEHIFNTIGVTNKIAVEFGVSAGGSGLQTNTRLLAEKGWATIWFDGEESSNLPPNCKFSVKFLTPDNIVETFKENGVPLEFDLLSIDVDGNDYHLREALCDFKPRVCIMEYNGYFTGTSEYIMPLNNEYRWKGQRNFGASLKSYQQQADRLGYDLVYCDSRGINAFFVRKDVNKFTPKSSENAFVKIYKVKDEKNLLDNWI
jgi:hypothetical protein